VTHGWRFGGRWRYRRRLVQRRVTWHHGTRQVSGANEPAAVLYIHPVPSYSIVDQRTGWASWTASGVLGLKQIGHSNSWPTPRAQDEGKALDLSILSPGRAGLIQPRARGGVTHAMCELAADQLRRGYHTWRLYGVGPEHSRGESQALVTAASRISRRVLDAAFCSAAGQRRRNWRPSE
jgi:hypothetical protein